MKEPIKFEIQNISNFFIKPYIQLNREEPNESQIVIKAPKTTLDWNMINRIANETNNETVFRFFERELLITAMNDYKIGESINVYPYQYFFNNYKKEIIKDIEEIQMLKDNYDLRIQLGLAISHREYNVLKRKLIIN